MVILTVVYIIKFFLEIYLLMVEGRFARHNEPESYADGSVSSW
jgi:hypothetical protein